MKYTCMMGWLLQNHLSVCLVAQIETVILTFDWSKWHYDIATIKCPTYLRAIDLVCRVWVAEL